MNEKKKTIVSLVASLVIVLLFLLFMVWYYYLEPNDIHILSIGLADGSKAERVENFGDYYVVIRECTACSWKDEDGELHLSFDLDMSSDKPEEGFDDFIWSQQEIKYVNFYQKSFLITKPVNIESYSVIDQENSIYLNIFPLKTDSGKIRYYYKRGGLMTDGHVLMSACKDFEFKVNGQPLEVINHCMFESEYDFINGEAVLYVGDVPCEFMK